MQVQKTWLLIGWKRSFPQNTSKEEFEFTKFFFL